ncbi:hypothetical protein [Yersinia enterocolitica]|uniref:hypothetical protein n=1 Tax=Yersinia enterocolitica TaxID=630 RepID=UPI0005E195D0|nr:hypothetical protein [Yersinia enterocolitica]CNK61253.1 Uncharacterised protein [Yersinia enterocolitica]CRY36510.1 Uncharacterised protein [Yersinia enterocolitica]
MTISTIHSTLKMAAAISDAKPVPPANNIHQRVAQAWQDNPVVKVAVTEKKEPTDAPQLSAIEQSDIDDFVGNLRMIQDKKDLFVLLKKKLNSLPTAERKQFIAQLVTTLKASELSEDKALLKEKFNPAYSMYLAANMIIGQLNQQSLDTMGKVPTEDDGDEYY